MELFVSILQHPEGAAAPGEVSSEDDNNSHPLGIVPHQIRGFLSKFSNVVITGRDYKHCSACSDNITEAYSQNEWEFVERALNESGYLEELSGLKQVSSAFLA